MKQYISKSALVEEIENLLDKGKYYEEYDCAYRDGNNGALYALKNKLNTLEVKEIDLEKEVSFQWSKFCLNDKDKDSFDNIAKHFFELGLNASNPLTWEDMLIIHKCIKDAMNFKLYKMMEGMEGQKEVYEEVLKRFKVQKENKL